MSEFDDIFENIFAIPLPTTIERLFWSKDEFEPERSPLLTKLLAVVFPVHDKQWVINNWKFIEQLKNRYGKYVDASFIEIIADYAPEFRHLLQNIDTYGLIPYSVVRKIVEILRTWHYIRPIIQDLSIFIVNPNDRLQTRILTKLTELENTVYAKNLKDWIAKTRRKVQSWDDVKDPEIRGIDLNPLENQLQDLMISFHDEFVPISEIRDMFNNYISQKEAEFREMYKSTDFNNLW